MTIHPEPGELTPLAVESTASLIARQLRSAIADGKLGPGTRLKEVQLAAQLDVSRAPLREAVQRLVQEGLLVAHANRGVSVIEPTAEDIADIYRAREVCEAAAVELVLGREDDAWVAQLTEAVEALESAAADDDWKAAIEADLAFHEALVQASGSARLVRLFSTLMVEAAICIHALETTYERTGSLYEEHRELLEALRSGERDAAVSAIRDHMREATARLTR